jgi:hypothetical protein
VIYSAVPDAKSSSPRFDRSRAKWLINRILRQGITALICVFVIGVFDIAEAQIQTFCSKHITEPGQFGGFVGSSQMRRLT